MLRNGLLILIILLLGFPTLAQDGDFPAPTCDIGRYAYVNHMDKGGFYLGRDEYMRAVTEYTCAIILLPDDALAYNSRGKALVEMGEYDMALLDYNQALEIDSNLVRVYNNRGWAYYGLREYDLALQEFNEAISRDPNYALAYNNRGVVYHRLEAYEQALSDYQQAIDLGLEPLSMGLINLGLVYIRVQDPRAAIESFEAALRDEPGNANARWWLGNAYYDLKDYTRARENYQAYADLMGGAGALEPLERLNAMSQYHTFIRVLPTLVIVVIVGAFGIVQGVRYWRKRQAQAATGATVAGGVSQKHERQQSTTTSFTAKSRGETIDEPVEQQESHTQEMQAEPSQNRRRLWISPVVALLAMAVAYVGRRALGQPDTTNHSSSP